MSKNYHEDSYGNKYTDHAVTGMQSSGHRYSGNDGGRGSGVIHYTDARGNDCDGSSIPAMCVDNALKNSTPTTTYRDGKECKVYVHDGIEVVTNSDGAVITTTKKY